MKTTHPRGVKRQPSQNYSDKDVAHFWNQNAEVWADNVRRGWDGYREYFNNPCFFDFLGSLRGKKVLDAGCGEGYNTRLLAKSGARIVGVDISSKLIEFARREEEERPLSIRYEVASYSNLIGFEDSSFDVVVSFMAMMDGSDYERAVKEVYRLLRPGGEFIFSITHPCFMTKGIGWVKDKRGRRIRLTTGDYFTNRPWIEHWKFSMVPKASKARSFAVPRFDRTLSDYLNPLMKSGFVLGEIREPRPSEIACKRYPDFKRWRRHGALFLYIRAAKPERRQSTTLH